MIRIRHDQPRRQTAPARRTREVAAARPDGDALYLSCWIAHQAELYGDLLRTIASAPASRAIRLTPRR